MWQGGQGGNTREGFEGDGHNTARVSCVEDVRSLSRGEARFLFAFVSVGRSDSTGTSGGFLSHVLRRLLIGKSRRQHGDTVSEGEGMVQGVTRGTQ